VLKNVLERLCLRHPQRRNRRPHTRHPRDCLLPCRPKHRRPRHPSFHSPSVRLARSPRAARCFCRVLSGQDGGVGSPRGSQLRGLSERQGDSAARCATFSCEQHGATRSDERVVNQSMPPPAVSPNAPSRPATRQGAARGSLAVGVGHARAQALRQRPLPRTNTSRLAAPGLSAFRNPQNLPRRVGGVRGPRAMRRPTRSRREPGRRGWSAAAVHP